MSKNRYFLIFILLLIFIVLGYLIFQKTTESQKESIETNTATGIENMELPAFEETDTISNYLGFKLLYNETYEQASWVAYVLTKDETIKSVERSDNFKTDPTILSGSANADDYKGSGYDRGHLAPAADMSWSDESIQESFYYSNMSPQVPGFNRGIWKKLEQQVRDWAVTYDSIYVVTGPILSSNYKTIGRNNVAVPSHYYKVLLVIGENETKGLGFILANENSKNELQSFVQTIDEVEMKTNLDFFSKLPDSIENNIESKVCIPCWKW